MSAAAHRRQEVLLHHLFPEGGAVTDEHGESVLAADEASGSSSSSSGGTGSGGPSLVSYNVRSDGVAVLTIRNPPVNQLSQSVLRELFAQHDRAMKDASVRAIVIIGSGNKFVAGADIAMIKNMQETNADMMSFVSEVNNLLNGIEVASKPCVAAIESMALGGGLEVAMACHGRVATPNANLGLPELQLGLIPGFGGTQRLPRLVGVQKALEMMLLSQPIKTAEAHKLGLVDVVARDSPSLLSDAAKLALDIASGAAPRRESLSYTRKLEPAGVVTMICEEARRRARQVNNKVKHPFECIDVTEVGATRGAKVGLKAEMEAFCRVAPTDTAKALVHFFFAQRSVTNLPGVTDSGLKPRAVKKLGVVGGGLMGAGIAVASLLKGIQVRVKEINDQCVRAAVDRVRGILEGRLKSKRLTQQQFDGIMNNFQAQVDWNGFDQLDMVIEAVLEKPDLKQSVFAELERVCSKQCILATNTSTIDIELVGAKTKALDRIVGLHFFSPAHVMPLLEIVRSAHTSAQVLVDSLAYAKQISKTPVVVGNCPGFAVNRIFFPYSSSCQFLVERGVDIYRIDKVLLDFGMPQGPFTMVDMAGVDVAHYAHSLMADHYGARAYRVTIAADMVKDGRIGQKSGSGYYKYEKGKREPIPDPEGMAKYVNAARQAANAAPVNFTDQEILEIIWFPVVNEACRVLEEGVCTRSSDIDVATVMGMGFPAWRGGLIKYADTLGSDYVYRRMSELHSRYNLELFRPSAYLQSHGEAKVALSVTQMGENDCDIVIAAACRTPVCRAARGGFKDTTPDELLRHVLADVLRRVPQVKPSDIGDVTVGCVLPGGEQGAIDARVAALMAGLPDTVPTRTINRLCSSGLQAIADVGASIQAGFYEIGIAAGVESMSTNQMGKPPRINPRATGTAADSYMAMGVTAENVASRFSVDRRTQDEFAARSHEKAAAAQAAGRFRDEITPVTTTVIDPKTNVSKTVTISDDDGVRAGTTVDVLAKLKPVFRQGGSVTAGNASQMSDGASAVMVMSRATARRLGIAPLATLRSYSVVGVPPAIMGVGPKYAIPRALEMAGLSVNDIDLFEINEAFASQCLYCANELALPMERVNVNGGAIALGHPLGCTGAKLTTQICYEAKRRRARYGVVSMCIGTGMGAAAVFEFPKN